MVRVKILNGRELAEFIKERQARQVRGLRQAEGIEPRLAIVRTADSPVIDTYVRVKQRYGLDTLVDVEQHSVSDSVLFSTIDELNERDDVHGIIVQLPLSDESQTEEAVNRVKPSKDVDGLGKGAELTPATPMAIDWLLAGYNVTLKGRKIAIVGNGRLVGAPLAKLWRDAGLSVEVFDENTKNMLRKLPKYDVIITAVGRPNLIPAESIGKGATVVDAATSSEHGEIVGDLALDVRARRDLAITPEKGGVGPLTVAALFDNVIRAARSTAGKK